MAKLLIVATPIGNLSDLGERAAQVLRDVPVVVSEVPRSSKVLLDHVESHAKLVPFFGGDKRPNLRAVLAELERGDVALVSEAGTPGINDPGGELVAAARAAGHTIVPLPGPNAAVAAASASGFPMDEFWFRGFVPHKKGRETFSRPARPTRAL
ncbi:MAG: SAM-dependent methyltransferase [Candidatus Andersenbacteria bacterium]